MLPAQCVRQLDAAEALAEILLMDLPHGGQMRPERGLDDLRKHSPPILTTLAVTNHDLVALKVDVLDAQVQAFHQAHTASVKQSQDQPGRAVHAPKYLTGLVAGQCPPLDSAQTKTSSSAFASITRSAHPSSSSRLACSRRFSAHSGSRSKRRFS